MPVLKASLFGLLPYLLLIWSGQALACGGAGAEDYLRRFAAWGGFLVLNGILLVLAVLARFLRRRYFPRRRLSPLLVGLVACVSMLLGGVASFLVPAFDALFTAWSLERAPSFVWLVDFRWGLWLPAAMALFAWFAARSEVARCRVFGAIFLVSINALLLALIVCYAPIFSFGCVA